MPRPDAKTKALEYVAYMVFFRLVLRTTLITVKQVYAKGSPGQIVNPRILEHLRVQYEELSEDKGFNPMSERVLIDPSEVSDCGREPTPTPVSRKTRYCDACSSASHWTKDCRHVVRAREEAEAKKKATANKFNKSKGAGKKKGE
jgi:hypothetical protein